MKLGWEDDVRCDGQALYVSCPWDHGSNMLVRTSHGIGFCLECFADLIASPSSLVLHRAQALSEFRESLTDSEFCRDLMLKRPEFLASPFVEAIFFIDDDGLGTSIVDAMVATCKLALENDDKLLQDVMLHICSHLSKSGTTPWKHGHVFSTHALGRLLELHCRHNNHIPYAIASQPGCVKNFVKAIALPTGGAGEDIFFLLVKLSTLEGGIQLLAKYCPSLVFLALCALEKTQSDDFRTKSLDLLIALAQASVFNIGLSTTVGQCDTEDQEVTASQGQTYASFLELFVEAMKTLLLSSDTQVQTRSLMLIDQVCPTSLDIGEELHFLVTEGLTDYIFEVLRVSVDLAAVATVAIQALVTLSLAFSAFSDHFSLGLEPLLRVLEHSFTSAFGDLQKDTLNVISAGIADRPGVISCARAEHLMILLRKSFLRYSSIIKDHGISDILGFGLSPEGLNATCGTLVTLLRAPSCSSIPSICQMLEDCVSALTKCISADPIYASQHGGLISAAHLLQESYFFCVQQNFFHEQFTGLAQFLMSHFHLQMLPVIAATWETISDEEVVNILFNSVKNIVQDGEAIKAGEFARTLISKYWVSMAFQSISKFPSEDLKQNICSSIGILINRASCGELVQDDIFCHTPGDVEGLLVLLEQRSHEDFHLIAAHQAIIALLFTTAEHGDRLVESSLLLSSLEQHLLVNASTSLLSSPSSPILKHFFLLFIEGQENMTLQGRFCSLKAENIMLDILQAAYESGSFDFELPLAALKWITKKERLEIISKDLLLKRLDGGSEAHATVAQLIREDDFVTQAVMSLFLDVVERHLVDEIKIVSTGLSSIIRRNWNFAKIFHSHGLVSTLRRFILLQGCKAPQATVTSCVELLFQVLLVLEESMAVIDEGAWLDIVIQVQKLLLLQLNKESIVPSSAVPLVNFISLIMHKSLRIPALQEAASKVCENNELRDAFEWNIMDASRKGSALTSMDINSEGGLSLRATLLFYILWLRCVGSRMAILCNGSKDGVDRISSQALAEKIASRISYQHVCQLLCFSKHKLQILASSCLVELLSHATESNGNLQENLAECSVNHQRSVMIILQGVALESDGLLKKNACICMMKLLAKAVPNSTQREAITRSPWYKTVAEELLRTLARVQVNVTESEGAGVLASLLSAILCVSPRYKWVPSVFNSQILTAALKRFKTTQHITVGTVDFSLELLKRGFLDREQVQTLRDLFQAVRRKCYRGRCTTVSGSSTIVQGASSETFVDTVANLENTIENMDSGTLIEYFALNNTGEDFTERIDEAQVSELNTESLLLVKIDEFLQRSV